MSNGIVRARQPDGTWRVVGEVTSLVIKMEIERRLMRDGEVFIDSRGNFLGPAEVVIANVRMAPLAEHVSGASKRKAPAWTTRHYGPSRSR